MRLLIPSAAMAARTQLALSEPPEGITIQSTSLVHDGVSVVLRADATKVQRGLMGNLLVDASIEMAVDGVQGETGGTKRRFPIGSLPAIPFRIVGAP